MGGGVGHGGLAEVASLVVVLLAALPLPRLAAPHTYLPGVALRMPG
jgi:hypothetical protein